MNPAEKPSTAHLGYGQMGYYVVFTYENGRRSRADFSSNDLWIEYLTFKLGKRWVKDNRQRIDDILRDVANGKTIA